MKKKNQIKTVTDLTSKQIKFVDVLVDNWGKISKAEAAKQAGYESKTTDGYYVIGSRLTNQDKLKESYFWWYVLTLSPDLGLWRATRDWNPS